MLYHIDLESLPKWLLYQTIIAILHCCLYLLDDGELRRRRRTACIWMHALEC
jgi:hypothetical protein